MLSLILLAVAGLNAVVNPYDVLAEVRITGINMLKPGVKNHIAMTKAYQIERARPATVVLGTSRAYIGIDAGSSAWPAAMRPVYNYGIPGYQVTSLLFPTLQEAYTTGGLRHAVVVLDYQAFLDPDKQLLRSEDDRRLRLLNDGTPNPERFAQRRSDVFLSLLTMGALVDSIKTILVQQSGDRALNLLADGTASDADFANAARADGMNALFAQKDQFEEGRAQDIAAVLAGWQGSMPNLASVREMISFCRNHGVTLTLVLGPAHSDALEQYRAIGLWPRIEQLKFDLAALVGESDGTTIALWDFLEYVSYTTEVVPPPGDRTTMLRWFWEPVHFRKTLGDVMLQRIFEGTPDGFGVRLTPSIVAARNKQVRAQRDAWKRGQACQQGTPAAE
jgi:hypothetical protein